MTVVTLVVGAGTALAILRGALRYLRKHPEDRRSAALLAASFGALIASLLVWMVSGQFANDIARLAGGVVGLGVCATVPLFLVLGILAGRRK